jgi:hypothetical protein
MDGLWYDAKGNVWQMDHNRLTGTVDLWYNGQYYTADLIGQWLEGEGISGAWDGRNKILKILGGLVVTIGIFEIVGASLAIFSLLFFLIKIVERRSSLQALLVSAITTLILHLLFKTWLGVPLPAGPWGF